MTEFFKSIVLIFELAAAIVLIIGAIFAFIILIKQILKTKKRHDAYRKFRQVFGTTLLLGLDLLVAADIIRTLTLDLTFETLGMLGLLVIIRTFLHFVLELEVTGYWPWQSKKKNINS